MDDFNWIVLTRAECEIWNKKADEFFERRGIKRIREFGDFKRVNERRRREKALDDVKKKENLDSTNNGTGGN